MAYAAAAGEQLPFLSKLESLASSAVRTAGNTSADLIVVYTATGGHVQQSHVAAQHCNDML
jgi:hypothetical protein